jgi:UDP-GlcNAc:undecaprenyl-phosphate/decaprenyl-phosphate GlcNAc-1-phosphate transferase
MDLLYITVIAGISCFLLTILLIPLNIKAANIVGAIDYPDKLKIHASPKPRFGGLAIFISVLTLLLVFSSLTNYILLEAKILISLSVAGIFLLGVFDDIKNLNAIFKSIVQLVSVLLVVIGLYLQNNSINPIFFIFIFLFIYGFTNAFNLIDGMDGLAAGVALFISLGLLTISLILKQYSIILSASLIIGASLGFLIFNFNPAKIFLGDCGSTFLGYSLSVMISIICLNSPNLYILIPLLFISAIPIIDVTFAIIRRIKNKKPIFLGDRQHLYDLVLQKGLTVRQTALLFYSFSLILTIIGITLYLLIH